MLPQEPAAAQENSGGLASSEEASREPDDPNARPFHGGFTSRRLCGADRIEWRYPNQ